MNYNANHEFPHSKMPFLELKSLKELYSPLEQSASDPMQYIPHNSEPSYSSFFEKDRNPFNIYSKPFVPKGKVFSPIMYTVFNDLSEKEKTFIVYYHQNCALCHESVPISPNTIILRDIINLICYALHQSCYNSLLISGKDVLNPSSIAKITIIKGELNLSATRKIMPTVSVDIFPVLQLKTDISLAVLNTIAINSYQCYSGEKTILLEQKFDSVHLNSIFTRIRVAFRWFDTNIEYSLDLLDAYNTHNSQVITLVLQCMNIHVYIEAVLANKTNIKDQSAFILSIIKVSIEITKAKLMSFTPTPFEKLVASSKYDEITRSCGSFAVVPPTVPSKPKVEIPKKELANTKSPQPSKQSVGKHNKTPKADKSSHKISKLENELLNNLTDNPVEHYKGKIFELAKTQQGSKYLQNVVQYSTQESISFIADEVDKDFAALLIDKYGNYFCQKFIQCIPSGIRLKLLKIVLR